MAHICRGRLKASGVIPYGGSVGVLAMAGKLSFSGIVGLRKINLCCALLQHPFQMTYYLSLSVI